MMDDFKDELTCWILFLLCTIFNLIVMLNLLIAIISDTYERVNSTKEQVAMKELANLVLDLRHFTCSRRFGKQKAPCDFLFIAVNQKPKEGADVDLYDVNAQVLKIKNR